MKINLGSGNKTLEGYVNVDKYDLPNVVVHDLLEFPYPFESESADEILMDNVLEHLSDRVGVIKECNRILKTGGKLIVRVPHFTSRGTYDDMTHIRGFGYASFQHYVKGTGEHTAYNHYIECEFSECKVTLHYHHSRIINWFINRHMWFYEEFLCYLFPCYWVQFELIK